MKRFKINIKKINQIQKNSGDNMTEKEEKILQEAQYYLNNDVTMEQAANNFGISKKSFQLHMKTLEQICKHTFNLVQLKKQNNLNQGIIKGGKNGKPSRTSNNVETKPYALSELESIILARKMIIYDWSLRKTEEETGIPKSTIRENMTKDRIGEDLYEEFEIMLESHKPQNRK